jgi:N-acylglucosamine-6-phosphate 2-epimerase
MPSNGLYFGLSDEADETARDYLHQQIRAFNDAVSDHHRALRPVGPRPLDVFIRDERDQIVGGLVAATYWAWLDVEHFWIHGRFRGQGYGRQLMDMAESEAITRGCTSATLQTFSFQARGFYEKLGYRVVGRLDGYPPGQVFFWMRKELLTVDQGEEGPQAA